MNNIAASRTTFIWKMFLVIILICLGFSRSQDYTDTSIEYPTSDFFTTEFTTSEKPPDSWCCVYEDRDACLWVMDGWYSSLIVVPASFDIPQHDGHFIWEQDLASSEISSVLLTGLPNYSTFSIDYFFNTEVVDEDDSYLQFSFETDLGNEAIAITWPAISTNSSIWLTKTLQSYGGICNGYSHCDGIFYVRTNNKVSNKQVVGIDNFHVNAASC